MVCQYIHNNDGWTRDFLAFVSSVERHIQNFSFNKVNEKYLRLMLHIKLYLIRMVDITILRSFHVLPLAFVCGSTGVACTGFHGKKQRMYFLKNEVSFCQFPV